MLRLVVRDVQSTWTCNAGLVESQRKNFNSLGQLAPCWYARSWLRDSASHGATFSRCKRGRLRNHRGSFESCYRACTHQIHINTQHCERWVDVFKQFV